MIALELIEIFEIDLDRCQNVYGVAPCTAAGGSGNECYNTFRTCQDKPNFVNGTKTFRFCKRGTRIPSGVSLRPYIEAIKTTPTKIDVLEGLATRSKVSIQMIDVNDSDIEQDPYIHTRASVAGATFFRRMAARNLAYAGRSARIKRLYVTPGDAYTLSDPGFVTELYVIDAFNGPDKSGLVEFVLKDPLKFTDRIKFPTPSTGELLSDITSTALSLTLKSGQGAEYGSSGVICVGNEIIEFTSRATDTLSWPSTAYREKFGTTAEAHSANDRVQLCKTWTDASVATVLEELLNAGDIPDSQIDLAGISDEDALWFGTYSITTCLHEPETLSDLISEFCTTVLSNVWWATEEQKVKFKAIRPLPPLGANATLLTDTSSFVKKSVGISRKEDDRITSVAVWYAPVVITDKKDDPKNYGRGYVVIDTDAEGENEYNDTRQKTIYARFLNEDGDQAAAELAIRLLALRRDAPIEIKGKLDPKDGDLRVGDQADIETAGMVDFEGDISRQRVLVTYRQDNGRDIDMSFLVTFLNRRYLWIAPDAQPDYGVATDEEKRYGYISNDLGKLSDGSDGHVIL